MSLGHRRQLELTDREKDAPKGAVATAPSAAPQDAAERRQVTVLFSDLAGSTGDQLAAVAVIHSVLALVVVLAMATAVGVVFAKFASPRGCGVYAVEAGSGAIRCVEVKPK